MFKSIRKILFGVFLALFLVSVIANVVVVVLLNNKTNEAAALAAEKATLQKNYDELKASQGKDTDTDTTSRPTSDFSTFEDSGMGISVEYPKTWTASLNTKVSDDFAYDPETGKVITKYDLTLTKGSSKLEFSAILFPTGGTAMALDKTLYDIVEVTPSVVRFLQKGTSQWKYVDKLDKSTCEEMGLEGASVIDECVGPFFPGFINKGAAIVRLTSTSSADIKEADAIIKTAITN